MAKLSPNYTCNFSEAAAARRWRAGLAAFAGLAVAALGSAAGADPVIVNAPFTAKPGDVFSLAGNGFGKAPRVFLKSSRLASVAELAVKTFDDQTIVTQIPKTFAFAAYEIWTSDGARTSPHLVLNAPAAHHFDDPDVAPGARFRIFGRNLYVGVAPTVTLIDVDTGAQLKATAVLSTSDAYCLDVAAPAGVVAGHRYKASVFNGYATDVSEATMLGHAAGVDYYAVGQPWAYDFITADGPGYKAGVKGANLADHHVFNVKTDVALTLKAVGDGKANDGPAIRAALNLARKYGGMVYLPAGVYNIESTSLSIPNKVVLKGQSAGSVKIIYKNTKPGFIIESNATLAGFADLTLQNQDKTSATANLGSWMQPVSKIIIQRVNWDLGTGLALRLLGDRIAVMNSTFTHPINYANGDPALKTGGHGPLILSNITNLQFKNNTVKWATSGNLMTYNVNAIIENNHFTRSASDTILAGPAQAGMSWPFGTPVKPGEKVSRAMGRQLQLDFNVNIVCQNNIFDTSDGNLLYNHNDGETILNEGGSVLMREDYGTVSSATGLSVSDASKCADACAWRIYPNAKVAIVSGAGTGQWRRLVAQNGAALTLDRQLDVVPAPGDHFVVASPTFENAIIRLNKMSGNPAGIGLYRGTNLNVSIVNNTLTNNGGIFVYPAQANSLPGRNTFNILRNIEINNNVLTNGNGLYPSFITICFNIITENTFWGKSVFAAEVRGNKITARKGTIAYVSDEGYNHFTYYQSPLPYADDGKGAMWGTVWQANSCANCAVNYRLGGGTFDATIWNAVSTNTPGFVSTFLTERPLWSKLSPTSTRTLIGKD